jgi:hypothetical protein
LKKEKPKENLTQDQTIGINATDESFSFDEKDKSFQYVNISQKRTHINNMPVN